MCLSVYLSVCGHSHGRILCRFSPNSIQRCKPPKVRTNLLWVNIAPSLPLLSPKNPHFDPEVLKIHANTKNAISASNVNVSPKFPRVI